MKSSLENVVSFSIYFKYYECLDDWLQPYYSMDKISVSFREVFLIRFTPSPLTTEQSAPGVVNSPTCRVGGAGSPSPTTHPTAWNALPCLVCRTKDSCSCFLVSPLPKEVQAPVRTSHWIEFGLQGWKAKRRNAGRNSIL